ncbi:MAG: hypothetical protein FWB76_08465 [Oscillospiraceae bacterium]|nr:hypothetical protein [Oscillospiraceae bacterium]
MQRNIKKRRLPIRPIVLILAVAVAWTLPWAVSTSTMARYITQSSASYAARVAAWDVAFGTQPAGATRVNASTTVFHTGATATHAAPTANVPDPVHRSGAQSRTFNVTNHSQVTADAHNFVLRYVITQTGTPSAASPVASATTTTHGASTLSATVRLAHTATSANRTIALSAPARSGTSPNFAIRWYRVFFDALQVD